MSLGTRAIDIDCAACGVKAGTYCNENDQRGLTRLCRERIAAAIRVTRTANEALRKERDV